MRLWRAVGDLMQGRRVKEANQLIFSMVESALSKINLDQAGVNHQTVFINEKEIFKWKYKKNSINSSMRKKNLNLDLYYTVISLIFSEFNAA